MCTISVFTIAQKIHLAMQYLSYSVVFNNFSTAFTLKKRNGQKNKTINNGKYMNTCILTAT